MIRRHARAMLEWLSRRYDYELRPIGLPPRGFGNFLAYARRVGLAPGTVFDVGVGEGTDWLYQAFPDAHLVLVEALPIFEDRLKAICRTRHSSEYHLVGAGEQEGVLRIRIPRLMPTDSSFYERSSEYSRLIALQPGEQHDDHADIPIRPLDSFLTQRPPFLLKIDVEGAELSVLKGAVEIMRQSQMIVVETSVLPRHAGEASFAEVVAFLGQNRFRLFDIPDLSQAGPEGPLVYLDAAFVPETFPHPIGGPA